MDSQIQEVDWQGARIVVLGFARQGGAIARYCARHGAQVVVSDLRTAEHFMDLQKELEDLPIEYVFGAHPPELLDGTALLCLSGGVPLEAPLVKLAIRKGVKLSNDAQIFLQACPAPVIGITGSAGKSTTTALIGSMARADAKASGRCVWVGGNIGRSLLEDLDKIGAGDRVVMELSSFQLEIMSMSPHIAALLNITPNHLDRHHTMEAYAAAKERILRFQSSQDVAVLGREDPGAWSYASQIKGRLLSFGLEPQVKGVGTFVRGGSVWLRNEQGETQLFETQAIQLRGQHNLINVAAACAICAAMGIAPEAMEEGVRSFQGLPHRLEFVRNLNGADWFNDSIATAPERSIAALRAFDRPIVLLAGGRDKDLKWNTFADEVSQRVDRLILFGEAASKIHAHMQKVADRERPLSIDLCSGLEEAVRAAVRVAREGDVVLLAPGGTSFDEFIDFEERGERFRALVLAL
ncbi:MAG TPA: UDP-N-acetylmuramoyl-L-alanine--D-glutamate ligase [Anaerolineae bacterium]|nr:UDP-N-acetylmuramoyl-L-alanine--D-glutamate ligase [Anaerolineae bacterium]